MCWQSNLWKWRGQVTCFDDSNEETFGGNVVLQTEVHLPELESFQLFLVRQTLFGVFRRLFDHGIRVEIRLEVFQTDVALALQASLLWLGLHLHRRQDGRSTIRRYWPSGIGSPLETEQVVSSIPGSVRYISHVHRAYDYLGPFGVLWLDTKIVLKKFHHRINRNETPGAMVVSGETCMSGEVHWWEASHRHTL